MAFHVTLNLLQAEHESPHKRLMPSPVPCSGRKNQLHFSGHREARKEADKLARAVGAARMLALKDLPSSILGDTEERETSVLISSTHVNGSS
jgi:hypothetical protein